MILNNFRWYIRPSDYYNYVNLVPIGDEIDNMITVYKPVVYDGVFAWEGNRHEIGINPEKFEDKLNIPREWGVPLRDALCDFYGERSKASILKELEATKKHLKDLQDIIFKNNRPNGKKRKLDV